MAKVNGRDVVCSLGIRQAKLLLVSPALMPDGESIEGCAPKTPLREKMIYEGGEAAVVGGFKQVSHFMHHDVFQALDWLLGKVGVQTDARGSGVATSPFRFHLLYEEAGHLHTYEPFPFCD